MRVGEGLRAPSGSGTGCGNESRSDSTRAREPTLGDEALRRHTGATQSPSQSRSIRAPCTPSVRKEKNPSVLASQERSSSCSSGMGVVSSAPICNLAESAWLLA
ncbi:hypothetical protein IscW_ISCW014911 [Ixodes scapularis]|uniref:Uncharacterized protein n=1 Tax=Ixodes scapularis TaxID=6945 RepID=B7QJQ5_IXOSC|nr:hypothetical protein IscW_ISCW014911 [Ixodes scapularis]|eukprot:XP_002415412.1 hypothetical protein IscW_ISCW014911 [Ixodes scapularis]